MSLQASIPKPIVHICILGSYLLSPIYRASDQRPPGLLLPQYLAEGPSWEIPFPFQMWTIATQMLSREKPCQALPASLPPPEMVQGAPGLAFAIQSITEQRPLNHWSKAEWDGRALLM